MADVTAAPFPLKLGDREFSMSPLNDRDIEELNNWLRSSFIQMARESLPDDASQAMRDETLRIAMTEARTMSWMEGAGQKFMKTIDGVTRVMYQGIKRNHPDVSFETIRGLLMNPMNLAMANTAWKELNLGKNFKTPSKGAEKKPERRRPKKRRTPS